MDAERIYIPIQPERLVALSRTTGAKVWTRDIESMWPPVVVADVLYVIASDEIHALDAATGAQRWRVPFDAKVAAPLTLEAGSRKPQRRCSDRNIRQRSRRCLCDSRWPDVVDARARRRITLRSGNRRFASRVRA